MRRLPSHIFCLGGLLALAQPASATGHRLWGQVRDPAGGVAGAEVIVAGLDTCLADPFGNYAFSDLPASCRLRVQAPGLTPLRTRIWLGREAFLPLDLWPPRHLGEGFAEDSLRRLDPFPITGMVDLDGDARPDRQGWQAQEAPRQELRAGLPRQDPWGGLWPEDPQPDGDLRPASERSLGAQLLGFPALFSASGAAGVTIETLPPPARTAIWWGASPAAGREAGGQAALGVGLWQRIWAQGRLADDDHAATAAGARRRQGALTLGHDWLVAPRLQLEQRVTGGSQSRRDLVTDDPGLWLHQPSMSRWEGDLRQRSLSWQGLARWSPSASLGADLLLWTRRRAQEAEGREWDRVLNRLRPEDAVDAPGHAWFAARRAERRRSGGLRAALEQRHERGLLQVALELERQQRWLDASLSGDSLLPGGSPDWISLREDMTALTGRLLDRYQWSPRLALEACLDLRYAYDEQVRRQVGLFQLSQVPQVAFNQDLLSLDPRLALRLRPARLEAELYWQRRRLISSPAGWWDAGRSPESLLDTPLVAAVGADQVIESLLPAVQVDQSGCWVRTGQPLLQVRLGLWGQAWRDLPLAWWTATERAFDPDQLRQPLDARQAGIDLRIESRAGSWSASLQGAWRRAWLEGIWWRPVADTSLWVGQQRRLERLPGVPDWACAAELSRRGQGPVLRLDPLLRLRWQGARDGENSAGFLQVPARANLDASLEARLLRWPDWRLSFWGRNLTDDLAPESATWVWDTVARRGRRVEIASAGRCLGLRLTWSPGP